MSDYDDSKDKGRSQAPLPLHGGPAKNQRRGGNQTMRASSGMLPPQKTAPPAVVMRKADGTVAPPPPFTAIPTEMAAWAFQPHLPMAAPQAPVQARGAAGGPSGHEAATEGVSGSGAEAHRISAFPHAAAIERATGLSLPGTASIDPGLAVPARTDGVHTVFATTPTLDVAAHEAAHQLQHAGLIKDAGLEPELQAEAIAEAVTAGTDTQALVAGGGSRIASSKRDYTEIDDASQRANNEWEVGSTARVGDLGLTVTTEMMHECYADSGLISGANEILTAKQSGVEIKAGSATISGNAPDGSGMKTLNKVVPTIKSSTAGPGMTQNLWTDCGRSSREVMGPTGTDTAPRGISGSAGGNTVETGTPAANPAVLRDDIFVAAGLGSTPDTARQAYYALSTTDREAFDKKYEINKYAAPGVGEAFVSRRHDQALQPGDDAGFNFHWGGVIMVAGGDRVTFENFAKPGTDYDSKDTNWYFETRGPATKVGQTFHEQNQGSVGGDVSDDNITLATTNANHAATAARMATKLLLNQHERTNRVEEKAAFEAELKKRTILVTVTSISGNEWGADEVWVEAGSASGDYTSSVIDIDDGHTKTFTIPMSTLVPFGGDLAIKVMEEDLLCDDTILDTAWRAPFDTKVETTAEYSVRIEFR